MAIERFVVKNYEVRVGYGLTATWSGTLIKAQGVLACYGADLRFIMYFLREDSPVPNPIYHIPNKVGAIFLPFKDMAHYVDLVRNEKPIYAYLNSDKPEWNNISTSKEPIGEEES